MHADLIVFLQEVDNLLALSLTYCSRAAQAFTFLLAGYETTASGLAFTAYCLAANPEKMAKLSEVFAWVSCDDQL